MRKNKNTRPLLLLKGKDNRFVDKVCIRKIKLQRKARKTDIVTIP
jgi:hypothetical protein